MLMLSRKKLLPTSTRLVDPANSITVAGNTDRPVAVQVLMETGLERLQRTCSLPTHTARL